MLRFKQKNPENTDRYTERTCKRISIAAIAVAALLVLALVPALALAAGENTDGSNDATGEAVVVQQEADVQAQDGAASAQPANKTMEVSFLVPVYNEDGNPKSGVREWKTETRVCTVVDDSEADWTDDNATGGWYVAVGNVSLDGSFICKGKINLVLADGCSLSSHGKSTKAGIRVTGSWCSLAVYSQSHGERMGRLEAVGGFEAAGIGGNNLGDDGNNIAINGGDVTATGGNGAAGIGGGHERDGHNITICGGAVTATGGEWAAGIGGGHGNNGYDITIGGGTVSATGGDRAAGIGGGNGGEGNHIAINGGTVVARGGEPSGVGGGAGIGGGFVKDGYDITIGGGTVTAAGGGEAAGIGGGGLGKILFIKNRGAGHDIFVTGGIVTAMGGEGASGIGGGEEADGRFISITGGTVTATGGYHASGIGGGSEADGHHISITAGTVTATGGYHASGIGGGNEADGHDISITGGTVAATGGDHGAGIGGGTEEDGYVITIDGGEVTATGAGGGAGIGGGSNGEGDRIAINGGTVNATGVAAGAGIGGGWKASGHNISITNGTVIATGSGGAGGIGGGWARDGFGISISGGDVTATGGENGGAGIGSGKGHDISITGGAVTATGADGGSGIGGGNGLAGYGISISGGIVTATGDGGGAGIGGGYKGKGSGISIGGGTVSATGSPVEDRCGASIGGGAWNNSEDVTVAVNLAAYYGADGVSWTALTSEQKSSDVSGILDPALRAVIGSVELGGQQGTLKQGEPSSASFAVSIGSSGAGPLTGVTGLTWEGAVPEGVTWSYADGTLTVSTSEKTLAGSYAFHIEADGVISGATALAVSKPIAYDVAYLDADGVQHTCPAAEVVGAACPCWSASGSTGGWYVVDRDVAFDGGFTCEGDIHLILADGCALEASGRNGEPGIAVEDGSSLTVCAQSTGASMGSLRAEGGEGAAGIGGFAHDDAGRVTIDGGRISATGNGGGAGIGGGEGGRGYGITIAGGEVSAKAGANGSAVGCGSDCAEAPEDIRVALSLPAAVSTDGEAWIALTDGQKASDLAPVLAGYTNFFAGSKLPDGTNEADAAAAATPEAANISGDVTSPISPLPESPQASSDPATPTDPQVSPTPTDPQTDSEPAALKLWKWLQWLANGTV